MTGRELKEMVDKLGWTQRRLAEVMGVTPQTISAILTAKDVRTSTIERMASVTNMPVSYFFGEEREAQNAVASSNSVAVTGNNNDVGNVTIGDSVMLQERIKALEAENKAKDLLLDEKERTIQILMKR